MIILYTILLLISAALPLSAAVRCRTGVYSGLAEDGAVSFRGIRYALPPLGERRFAPPEPVPASDASFEAVRFGDASPQSAPTPNRQSEDCLWLNVCADMSPGRKDRPVMAFIHGGAYISDSSAMDIYDLRPLAKAFGDVVFVSVEYRLGLLGFGDFRMLEGGGCCSPGLLDIACALEWIRDNIEAFGGDPGRVTLFGQSAGAGCISLLPLLPQARGLFRRMILQSGSPSLVTTPEAAQKTAAAFMDKTGCRSLKDLQRLPGEAFAAFAACAPVTESPLLPRSLTEIYQKAASPLYGGIDILAGTNRDEMDYFTLLLGRDRAEEAQAAAHRRRLALLPEGAKEKAQKLFSPENGLSPYEACCRFAGAALFHAPCLALCRARRAFRTYAYSFEVPSGKPGIGACHAAELSYVFGNFRYGYAGKNAAPGVSGLMQQLWTSFAETGVPEAENLLWPPFGNSGCALVFAPDGAYARENAFGKYEALEELAYIPVHAAGLF